MGDLASLIGEIEKKFGDGMVRAGSKGRSFKTKRFMTGIFDADAAIGGGPVWGRFHRVFGPYSGGKTSYCLKAVAGGQRFCRYCRDIFLPDLETGEMVCSCPAKCPECSQVFKKVPYKAAKDDDDLDKFCWERIFDDWTCKCLSQPTGTRNKKDRVPKVTQRAGPVRTVWVDAENCYDRDWAEKLGVDNDLVYVVTPEFLEQAGDIVELLIRSGEVDLFVVDSIAELTPSDEIERSTEEYQVGLHARKMNKALRKWGAAMNALGSNADLKPAVLLINQTRESMSHGEVTPGGWMQYFKSSVDIRMGAAKYAYREYKRDGQKLEELLYADTSGVVKKNKTHVPQKRFSYRFYLANVDGMETGSTNEVGVLIKRALEWEVVQRGDGASKGGYSFMDRSWKTQKALARDLHSDVRLFYELRAQTMAVVVNDAKGL